MANYTLKYLLQLARRGGPELPFDGTEVVHIAAGADGKDYHCMLIDLLGLGGYPTWDSEESYDTGGRVTYGLRLWESLIDANVGNVPTEGANWTEVSPDIQTKFEIIVTAAQMRGCGTTPVQLLPAAGIGKYYSITKIPASKAPGVGASFDFTDHLKIYQKEGANIGDLQFSISNIDFNPTGPANFDPPKQGGKALVNGALMLSTVDGANASTGDSDTKFTIYANTEIVHL